MLSKSERIFLAGHKGLVGSSILRLLKEKGFKNIITENKNKLNLLDQSKVVNFLKKKKVESVILAAAKVGGIKSNNTYKAQYIYENLQIQNNVIHGSFINNIKNLVFLGSSCIYPKFAKQPIKESELLNGKLEPTNEPYAIAKIAGLKMCEFYNYQYGTNYKCLMPCNLYGPNDNYDSVNSHFLPALIKKIYECKLKKKNQIVLWGSGKPKRELMFVDDLAEACLFFLKKKTRHNLINIGSGYEKTIRNYARIIMGHMNIKAEIKYIRKNLDGTPRKILDCSIARSYKWKNKTSFEKGIKLTIEDFKKNQKT